MPTEITTLESDRVRLQVASIFASVKNDEALMVWEMISLVAIQAWIGTVVCQEIMLSLIVELQRQGFLKGVCSIASANVKESADPDL